MTAEGTGLDGHSWRGTRKGQGGLEAEVVSRWGSQGAFLEEVALSWENLEEVQNMGTEGCECPSVLSSQLRQAPALACLGSCSVGVYGQREFLERRKKRREPCSLIGLSSSLPPPHTQQGTDLTQVVPFRTEVTL